MDKDQIMAEARNMVHGNIKEAEELVTRAFHRIDVLREHMDGLSYLDVGPTRLDVEDPVRWSMGIRTILEDSCSDLQKARDILIGP